MLGANSKGTMPMAVLHQLDNRVRRSAILKRLFVTREGKIVVAQAPNAPLYVWLVFGLATFFTAGGPRHWCMLASEAALAVWSVLEIGWGVNLFRRVLGLVVGILVVGWILRPGG